MRLWVSVLMSCCVSAAALAEEPVYFADPNLKTAVEMRLWISDPTPADMLGLTWLWAPIRAITDLTGLEYATNLQELRLNRNEISDLAPLSGLTNLKELILHDNRISDISPLLGLSTLQELDLDWNQVSDLSALSGLDNLKDLRLLDNQISNLRPLSGLQNLQNLWLSGNQIADVSVLSGLGGLCRLRLDHNHISDVSALLGLTNLEYVVLRSNPLNDQAYRSHLQTIVDNNPGIHLLYSPNHMPPADVTASNGTFSDRVRITWQSVCNGPEFTSHYQVSRALSAQGPQIPVSEWQTALSFDDLTAETAARYVYSVRTATSIRGLRAGDYSEPDVGWVGGVPTLRISSAAGGSVTMPGEGAHEVEIDQVVAVRAEPDDPNLYFFAGWTGSGVDAGYLADANAASTTITIEGTCALQANFLTWMTTIYVDDNAPSDPGPQTAAVSDPCEDGTREHPFDTIQEGMDVALDGATIIVADGTYGECLVFGDKSITVTGFDSDEPIVPKPYPVVDANYEGTPVSFVHGRDSNSTLAGFVITRGESDFASGVRCRESRATIANCLIVGNRAVNRYGAAVYCVGSGAVFVNCTIADNADGESSAGMYLFDSNIGLTNCILRDNTPRDIRVDGASDLSITYANVTRGWPGPGSIDADPLFAEPGWWADPNDPDVAVEPNDPRAIWIDGDYHLQSQAGRWDPRTQTWIQDDVTSPCIDAGDPAVAVGDEVVPHGGIINMGAYGGTSHASKSPDAP